MNSILLLMEAMNMTTHSIPFHKHKLLMWCIPELTELAGLLVVLVEDMCTDSATRLLLL